MSYLSSEQTTTVLEKCYSEVLKGIPGTSSAEKMANDYLNRYKKCDIAAKKLIDNQIKKCSASGFITNIGGLATLGIAIPANITSVLYWQLRMIVGIAIIGGYNPQNDEVQTLSYMCLVGTSITDICKSAGVRIGNKATTNMLKNYQDPFSKK